MLPIDYLNQLKSKITNPIRVTFIAAFLGGLLIHMFRLTNTLLTWDSVFNFHDAQNTIHLGRWFLSIACGISSYYDLQWVNGLISLLYLAISAVIIVCFFDISDPILCTLVGLLFVSFPTVCSTFSYMYTADGYFLGMVLMLAGLSLSRKSLYSSIGGAVLFALGMGCYQAYISFVITLILIYFLVLLISREDGIKQIVAILPNFLILGVLGSLLSMLLGKLLSIVEGIPVSDYNGMSSMSFSIANIPFAIKNSIIDFAYFFFGPLDNISMYKIGNVFLFILILLLFVLSFYVLNRRNIVPVILICLLIAVLIPIGCGIIYFISPEVNYYMLMNQGYISIYLLPLCLCQNIITKHRKISTCSAFSTVIILSLIVFNFSIISNISYQYMEASNQATLSLVTRMVDRIEKQPTFNQIDKLCIIGELPNFDEISYNLPPSIAGIRDGYFIDKDKHFAAIMSDRFNTKINPVTDIEKESIENDISYSNMPVWPAEGSCITKENIVIIRFN